MKKQNYYIVFILIVFVTLVSFKSNNKTINLTDKIYTQTDRPFYFPGETIWFKSYIVNPDNTIASLSDIVNAELISPKGSVVKSIKLSINQGYSYGDFYIDEDWVGGIYTLKIYTNWMRNFGEDSFFTKKITVQKVVKPNLLLNLKFEKEGYGKSSQVISNFEVKDLKNIPLKNKTVAFDVSVKGEKIISNKVTTNQEGKAKPTFKLPENLSSTDVVLNVLIPYNGTTESISRSVPVVLDNIDLQFFPESGKTIAKTDNNMAFKALNEFGKPVDVKGTIFDENDKQITTFNSFHDGMGMFQFKPKENTKYYAKITTPFVSYKKIELPKIHTNGTCFSIKTDSLKTTLHVFSNSNKTLTLEASNSTKKLYSKAINTSEKNIIVNTENFPIGITKFSLLDNNKDLVAERIVFINAHKQLNVSINLDKSIYKTREKVNVTIKTTDANNKPIPSNLSVAIADNKLLSFADDKQDHILSSLLLSSELKGKIHKPAFYFNPKKPKSPLALDYIMLTHGWRNYVNHPEITLENSKFKPEQIGFHSGTIVDKRGNPTKAKLLLFDDYENKVLVFKTNNTGEFQFKSVKKNKLTLLAYTEDGDKLKIIKHGFKKEFYVDDLESKNKTNLEKSKAFSGNNKLLKSTIKEKATANVDLKQDVSSLDEVVVVGYGTMKKSALTGSVIRVVSEEVSASGNTLSQALQGRVGGVMVSENFASGESSKITIRGNNSISGNSNPMVVVDGVICDSSMLSNLDANQIDSVSILKDVTATAIYGCYAANGVIIVSTKNGKSYNNWNKKRLNNAKYNNYTIEHFYHNGNLQTYNAKTFYMPKYSSKELPEERTDFRQTIYWNPVVQTDENGEAKFEFYNSDAITSFKITTEGIGFNGLVGRTEKTYATQKIVNIDFKAPNYMALNDTVILPISITNESNKTIAATLDINLPEQLKLAEFFEGNLNIKAKNTIIKNIKVIPVQKANNVTISASLKGTNFKDVVKRKATILSPYFPMATSISGSESQNFSFNINNAIKNSINTEFNIYTDIVGNVMDGIEGLIRQPYGCFEQTSSSTYPNIMVLKYLKEAGKSNPEIEQKAMDFIKQGYKRLISFETNEGGFEWFGHTPPHETLTAYGILEFTEMKEVYDGVDQNMINRTVKWLLSRKDGKGSFKKSKQGYDSFASSPTDVANAYIVYALSEAKINEDFNLEYETAYKDAIKTNDTYKMALMALTSYNLNKQEQAKTLIAKIKANIEKHTFNKLPVENTITRSYGNAKNIETIAFSLLALMREGIKDDTLIAKGIKSLVEKRSGNTFGSTQSTAMALKALIEYTKTEKQKLINENDTIELIINGKTIAQKLKIQDDGKITVEDISKYLKEGKQNIGVKFSNPKVTFPYTLNINWESHLPNSSTACALSMATVIPNNNYKVGDNVSMRINISNKKDEKLGMATAIIGLPSGTTAQPWQLKEILEKNKIAYYEIFDNYLVFYWREFDVLETKTIRLDLKADIAGSYKAPASTVYLYYGDEHKTWISGNTLTINSTNF